MSSLLYNCILSVGNSDSPEELDVIELAKFAYIKPAKDSGYDELD
ncbi:MAG: hypothetical protein ACLFPS_09585 [Clostridia bacterium]